MARSTKVAVTLPEDVYDEVERLRRRTKESRSAVVQRALRQLLQGAERQQKIRAYVEAYRREPENDAEVEQAQVLSAAALADLPWE